MIFPFQFRKQFKLPDSEFAVYDSAEIIDKIYNHLQKNEYKFIQKQNNEIEFSGDRNKWKNQLKWSKTDRIGHCIDKGIVRIVESENERKLVYKFQILKIHLWFLLPTLLLPIFFGLVFQDIEVGLEFFWILFSFELIYWIFLIVFHPSTITAPLEKLRTDSVRKNNTK